jgi:hypothetical protein
MGRGAEGGLKMTEKEWLNNRLDPQAMVGVLQSRSFNRTKAGKRKLRLFACGCCRLFWDLLTVSLLRQCVEVAEQFAEAQVSKQELQKHYESARLLETGPLTLTLDEPTWRQNTAIAMAVDVAQPNAFSAAFAMTTYPVTNFEKERATSLYWLLHCVFGNPFRPITLNPQWLTPTVKALAEQIYNDRTFDRMPVLADALEEAGCTVKEVLEHCRNGGEHVRGCWVVDQVLGKE